MKKQLSSLLVPASLVISMNIVGQPGVEKKIIATLGPGEHIANGENCFMLGQSPETISFVTVTGSGASKQFYCYGKDGTRIGPVKSPDPKYWSECADKKADDCIPNDDPPQVDIEKYYDFTSQSVKFQGKNIGPPGQPMHIAVSQDGQHIYAINLTTDMKMFFFDNTGRKIELTGTPEQIIVGADGKNAFAKVIGTINPFTPDAYTKMMENPEEMSDPKITLVGMDGSQAGPFRQSAFNDAWFTVAGQWIVYANSEIYLDGKLLFKSDDYFAACDFWVNATGSDYAWANYEYLIFKDGTKYTAPIEIKYSNAGGKGHLKWISLEAGKDLVFYKKAF